MKKILLALCLCISPIFAAATQESPDIERLTQVLIDGLKPSSEKEMLKVIKEHQTPNFWEYIAVIEPYIASIQTHERADFISAYLSGNFGYDDSIPKFTPQDLKKMLEKFLEKKTENNLLVCVFAVLNADYSFEHLEKMAPYTSDGWFILQSAKFGQDQMDIAMSILKERSPKTLYPGSMKSTQLSRDHVKKILQLTKNYTEDEYQEALYDLLQMAPERCEAILGKMDSYYTFLVAVNDLDRDRLTVLIPHLKAKSASEVKKMMAFISQNNCTKEEIESGEAVEWCNKNSNYNNINYPIKRRNGIQELYDKGAHGSGRTIAVYDNKFTRILGTTCEQFLPFTSHYDDWQTREYDFLEEHGSMMIERILRVTPKAKIWPVNGFFSDTATITKAFYDFGDNSDLHVINCSFELPCSLDNPYIMSAELKEAIRYCLSKNKVIVLAASNTNRTILDKPREMKEGDAAVATETLAKYTGVGGQTIYESLLSSLFAEEPENSLFFKNLIIAGECKVKMDAGYPITVKSGTGPASKVYVCAANEGGTSFAAAMISGIVANLWSVVDDAPGSAERVVQALLETADTNDDYDPAKHGRGFANAAKALEKLMPSQAVSSS